MAPELRTTVEGRTRLLMPAGILTSRAPATHPFFFNPAARLNRDVSVALANATEPRTYLDALAGTGARGVRVAREGPSGTSVTLVDFNQAALEVACRNIAENGVSGRCLAVHEETNRFLYSRFDRGEKFDAVDVDPFGSPAPYLQGAMSACADRAILSFTATDAAVLCAVYPSVTLRRYGSSSVRSDFVHETALRILVGFAARAGGVNDIGVEPVAVHSTLHYLRVFVRTRRGASHSDAATKKLGFVTECNSCGARSSSALPLSACPGCGKRTRSAGPLWTGSLADWRLVAPAIAYCEKEGMEGAGETLGGLNGLDGFPPFSFSIERACSRLRAPSVSSERVMAALKRAGFAAAAAPFDERTLKTTADYRGFLQAVREASGASAQADQVHL